MIKVAAVILLILFGLAVMWPSAKYSAGTNACGALVGCFIWFVAFCLVAFE